MGEGNGATVGVAVGVSVAFGVLVAAAVCVAVAVAVWVAVAIWAVVGVAVGLAVAVGAVVAAVVGVASKVGVDVAGKDVAVAVAVAMVTGPRFLIQGMLLARRSRNRAPRLLTQPKMSAPAISHNIQIGLFQYLI